MIHWQSLLRAIRESPLRDGAEPRALREAPLRVTWFEVVKMAELPYRKRNRLAGYDYSAPGAYFVTVCTHEKRCILSHIAVGALHEAPDVTLTEAGEIVRRVVESLPQRYPNIELEKYVIMPNHVHLLLVISGEREIRESPLQGDRGEGRAIRESPLQGGAELRAIRESPLRGDTGRSLLAKAIGYMKMNSSKQIHILSPAQSVWQRSFHDHVVRDEREYQMIWEYIDGNAARWADDCYYQE